MSHIDLDPIKLAGKKAKGKRPYFLDDPAAERNMSIIMAVAGELAVMRERMDTIERLLEESQLLRRAQIDSYVPDDQASAERMRWQQEYVARILRIVQQEREALEQAMQEQDVEELAVEFSTS